MEANPLRIASLLSEICEARKKQTVRSLTESESDALRRFLAQMLVSIDRLRSHVHFLETQFGARYVFPLFRRDRFDGWELKLSTGFPERGTLPEEDIRDVLEHTTATVSSLKLERLLVNPDALVDLFDVIDEVQPDAWNDAFRTEGASILAASPEVTAIEQPKSSSESSQNNASPVSLAKQTSDSHVPNLSQVLTMAASLLAVLMTGYLLTSTSAMRKQIASLNPGKLEQESNDVIQRHSADGDYTTAEQVLRSIENGTAEENLRKVANHPLVGKLVETLTVAKVPPERQIVLVRSFLQQSIDQLRDLKKFYDIAKDEQKALIEVLEQAGFSPNTILSIVKKE